MPDLMPDPTDLSRGADVQDAVRHALQESGAAGTGPVQLPPPAMITTSQSWNNGTYSVTYHAQLYQDADGKLWTEPGPGHNIPNTELRLQATPKDGWHATIEVQKRIGRARRQRRDGWHILEVWRTVAIVGSHARGNWTLASDHGKDDARYSHFKPETVKQSAQQAIGALIREGHAYNATPPEPPPPASPAPRASQLPESLPKPTGHWQILMPPAGSGVPNGGWIWVDSNRDAWSARPESGGTRVNPLAGQQPDPMSPAPSPTNATPKKGHWVTHQPPPGSGVPSGGVEWVEDDTGRSDHQFAAAVPAFTPKSVSAILEPQLGPRGVTNDQIGQFSAAIWDGIDLTLKTMTQQSAQPPPDVLADGLAAPPDETPREVRPKPPDRLTDGTLIFPDPTGHEVGDSKWLGLVRVPPKIPENPGATDLPWLWAISPIDPLKILAGQMGFPLIPGDDDSGGSAPLGFSVDHMTLQELKWIEGRNDPWETWRRSMDSDPDDFGPDSYFYPHFDPVPPPDPTLPDPLASPDSPPPKTTFPKLVPPPASPEHPHTMERPGTGAPLPADDGGHAAVQVAKDDYAAARIEFEAAYTAREDAEARTENYCISIGVSSSYLMPDDGNEELTPEQVPEAKAILEELEWAEWHAQHALERALNRTTAARIQLEIAESHASPAAPDRSHTMERPAIGATQPAEPRAAAKPALDTGAAVIAAEDELGAAWIAFDAARLPDREEIVGADARAGEQLARTGLKKALDRLMAARGALNLAQSRVPPLPQSAPTLSLGDALKEGLVELELLGGGAGVTAHCNVRLTLRTNRPLAIAIPPGTAFAPSAPGLQTMVCAKATTVLSRGQEGSVATATISTVCASPHGLLPPPADGSAQYTVSPTLSPIRTILETVEGLSERLSTMSHSIGMPASMFADAVVQYTTWWAFGNPGFWSPNLPRGDGKSCPNCRRPYEPKDLTCRNCGYLAIDFSRPR